MKNFISKPKQMILNILDLKSKPITILLGTFVPFFLAHIIAYTGKKVNKGKYIRYFSVGFTYSLILYIFCAVALSFLEGHPMAIFILLGSYLIVTFTISLIYYSIIPNSEKKPKKVHRPFLAILKDILILVRIFSFLILGVILGFFILSPFKIESIEKFRDLIVIFSIFFGVVYFFASSIFMTLLRWTENAFNKIFRTKLSAFNNKNLRRFIVADIIHYYAGFVGGIILSLVFLLVFSLVK